MTELAIAARKGRATVWLWVLVVCGVIALLAANAHLLYVASASQPACVNHRRDVSDAPGYRAAKSSCSPAANASEEGNQR